MFLSRVKPTNEADHDRRTFECTACQHSKTVTVKSMEGKTHEGQIRTSYRPFRFPCATRLVRMRNSEGLVGIEPDIPGHELHTFQCPKCEHFETAVGKAA